MNLLKFDIFASELVYKVTISEEKTNDFTKCINFNITK